MYLYMITAENTMIHQYTFFILQEAIHNIETIQHNQRHKDTQQHLLHIA